MNDTRLHQISINFFSLDLIYYDVIKIEMKNQNLWFSTNRFFIICHLRPDRYYHQKLTRL